MLEKLEKLRVEALEALETATTSQQVEEWRVRYLSRAGELRRAASAISEVPSEEKPTYGKALNELKRQLIELHKEKEERLGEAGFVAEALDITLPGTSRRIGHVHPITRTTDELIEAFARLGFAVADGPEIEDCYHNFDALNIPPEHPSRDDYDTFYIAEDSLLRSQTSTVQIRVMESQEPPVRVIAPGRCFRPDTVDATHYYCFHQIEGLAVEEGVTFGDLKATLTTFARTLFGAGTETRFRPSFFPFTEPSAEMDVSCPFCTSAGDQCSVCKGVGWVELGGCGMVDPNVLDAVGYDSEKYTGWAFGFGIERLCMMKYGIKDIRLFFGNDLRFLEQF